ncbi:SPARC-related modular calcium-binding protein 2-like isoform X4 [Biomphalaria glabrata]|uniref:SPARC-related modular calcium-binding protein 2-like isoform X4 n=1 Tax=Biomphalaria glabrata TaxID=6526 RepID=A0A9W2ZXW6_BIOGL|nr:SPARC-related modular calcium-binding protein 2-like isoform X4 [Biomphalaria glabrata]
MPFKIVSWLLACAVSSDTFIVSFLAVLLWASGAECLDIREVDGKSLFQSLLASRCSVTCPTYRGRPVCGTDDVTYMSKCELRRAVKCDSKNVQVKHKGSCPGDAGTHSKCFKERNEATEASKKNLNSDVLIPTCNPDGSYFQIQCHTSSGYCWCVTKDGRHIVGTSSKAARPICNAHRKKRKGRGGTTRKPKEECSTKDRQTFNTALIKVFKEEYDRANSANTTGGHEDDEFGTEKAIVLWKFNELDKNKDGKLKFKEIRHFKKMVKKLIKPKPCAQEFLNFCDKKPDRTIEKADWTLCLGVDIKPSEASSSVRPAELPRNETLTRPQVPLIPAPNFPVLNGGPLVSSSSNRQEKPERKESTSQSCMKEREDAIKDNSQQPNAKYFIPACTSDGLWEKAQCHEHNGYCWCVKQSNGVPIPGTATFNVTPNCDFDGDRELKGCPFEQKRKFLMDLLSDLTEERKKALSEAVATSNPLPAENLALLETVARWKLKNLDKNNNEILEKREWRPFRKTTLKSKSYPRKCRRSFLRYCDADNNKKITFEEWKDCLGLNQIPLNSLPINPKRKGKNPFSLIDYLKEDE